MNIGILKESRTGEHRVAVNPAIAASWVKDNHKIWVEQGAGLGSSYTDEQYTAAGVQVADRNTVLNAADLLIQINVPD